MIHNNAELQSKAIFFVQYREIAFCYVVILRKQNNITVRKRNRNFYNITLNSGNVFDAALLTQR